MLYSDRSRLDLSGELSGTKVFSTFDAKTGYWQI